MNINRRFLPPALMILSAVGCTPLVAEPLTESQWRFVVDEWETIMEQEGRRWGEYLDPASGHSRDERLVAQYYDAQWVFFQVSDRLGGSEPWNTFADYAKRIYKDEYLVPNDFASSGYRRFPHGLYFDFLRGRGVTAEEMELLRDRPAYSRLVEFRSRGDSERLSRETAYAIQANVLAERAGSPRMREEGVARLEKFVEYSENHLWEWRTQGYRDYPDYEGRLAPFMFGLTAMALIEFHEWERESGREPDAYWPTGNWSGLAEALADTALWLRYEATMKRGPLAGEPLWVPDVRRSGYGAFRYEDKGESQAAPDLSNLIAPVYMWLYLNTGDERFKEIGDELFAGAVYNACARCSGKHFNQLMRHSFQYVAWRAAAMGEGAGARGTEPNPPTDLEVD